MLSGIRLNLSFQTVTFDKYAFFIRRQNTLFLPHSINFFFRIRALCVSVHVFVWLCDWWFFFLIIILYSLFHSVMKLYSYGKSIIKKTAHTERKKNYQSWSHCENPSSVPVRMNPHSIERWWLECESELFIYLFSDYEENFDMCPFGFGFGSSKN